MADDQTRTLNGEETPEQRILSRLDAIDERLASLEAKAEERSRDTRPLFEQAIKEMQQTRAELGERLSGVERELRHLGRKIDVFSDDLIRTRIDVRDLDARVTALEQERA